jgi:predicted ATPase
VRDNLPTGTVTFLFTDVEGSTKLLHELGVDEYARALAEHRRILREAFTLHGGVEVDTQGDAFFVAFPNAPGALQAAADALAGLGPGPISVRMGIHTGTPHLGEEGYIGADVHKGARVAAAGHGGQVLLSQETRELVAVEVTDLGEHRLKDFQEPVWIFQFGSERFPALKTISNTNLPRPASSFVGRDKEVAEVAALLQDGARLLTLSGPGGTGKTRLAIEAAAEVVPEFKAGVFWVGLASLRDPTLVGETIAQTLGGKGDLAGHIAERELLLLLDNLEQVVDAAPELATLVESCPNLRLLVTSRELLGVRGEVEYPVLPLAESEAVELFCARAGTEADESVHELCRALDDLPLALELAAARASVLSPRQIVERLAGRLDLLKGGRDADPRQQTLRATIGWSHDLLDEAEQRLFARLAVFAGGCTLEAAEKVCDADLDTLQSLVDKSLVRFTNERYWMLETIRAFASERLAESGEVDDLRARHADWYLEFAERAQPELRGGEGRRWLDRLEAEHANLRLAIQQTLEDGDGARALRLTGAVWWYWLTRGHWTEGRRLLEAALALANEHDLEESEDVLDGAALLAFWQGDDARGLAHATHLLEISRACGRRSGEAVALNLIAHGAAQRGDFERARVLWEASLAIARDLNDEWQISIALNNLGDVELNVGNFGRALELFEESLPQAQGGDFDRRARGLANMGFARLGLDDNAGARAEFANALKAARAIGVRETYVNALLGLAATWVGEDPPQAGRLQGVSDAIATQLGTSAQAFEGNVRQRTLARLRASPAEDIYLASLKYARPLSPDDAVAYALETPGD